jgi:hypothetical protein
MLLAHPDRVKAQLFSVDHEIEGVLIIGQLVLALRKKIEQGEQTELHRSTSLRARVAPASLPPHHAQ